MMLYRISSSWQDVLGSFIQMAKFIDIYCYGWPSSLDFIHWLECPSVLHCQLVANCWQMCCCCCEIKLPWQISSQKLHKCLLLLQCHFWNRASSASKVETHKAIHNIFALFGTCKSNWVKVFPYNYQYYNNIQ